MRTMSVILSKRLREPDLRSRLHELLGQLGYDTELEFQTGDGPADIYLPARRFVIETKSYGKADPQGAGSGGGTQLDQCHRYVRADYRRESQQLGFGDDPAWGAVPWKAALTDGPNWWLWEWQISSEGNLPSAPNQQKSRRFTPSEPEIAVDWLAGNTKRTAGKRWVPSDPTEVFKPFGDHLKTILGQLGSDPGTQTKRRLWMDMLRGSGSAPVPDAEADIFVQHTLLVTVARAVIATLSGSAGDPLKVMADGFASWPQARSFRGPTHKAGADWTKQIFRTVDGYDWRQRGQDVLQVLYQNLIDKSHRKDFGEYYTPDWLAEAVVEKVLDDEWLERSVPAIIKNPAASGVGVLDPACGSGTFLFHAARRILGSDAVERQGLERVVRADLAAGLINGIDIHPVAVEISRATLLRALPAAPSKGVSGLRVFQGDSLLWNSTVTVGDENAESDQGRWDLQDNDLVIRSAKDTQIRVPLNFAVQSAFSSDVNRIVENAHRGTPMPTLFSDVDDRDMKTLESTFAALTQVIAEEGNSVWAWYITNAAAALAIRERSLDRLVANPPWVRMSHITVKTRKQEMESLAKRLKLWGLGKANTAFDIAALFVVRCRGNYLTTEGSAAGWVLPWGALKGDNWESARVAQRPFTNEAWDLSEIREQPFTGSKSCVWIQTIKKRDGNTPSVRRLANHSARKVNRNDSWAIAQTAAIFVDVTTTAPPVRSSYFTGPGKGKPVFAQGATLVPHCLAKVQDKHKLPPKPEQTEERFWVTTVRSRHEPWKSQGQHEGEVPSRWVHKTVFSNDLLVYVLRDPVSETILPLTEKREPDPERENNTYWDTAKRIYARNKGQGKNTPATLWKQFDFQNKLLKQFTNTNLANTGKVKVLYNGAGQYLRAARCAPAVIAEHIAYHATFGNEKEACYMTAMLNAACLQEAYARSRKSDRHFEQRFWYSVPIPRYDSNNADHNALAELCVQAEAAALAAMTESGYSGGQIKCSNTIRRALTENYVSQAIDEVVRDILPGYATP